MKKRFGIIPIPLSDKPLLVSGWSFMLCSCCKSDDEMRHIPTCKIDQSELQDLAQGTIPLCPCPEATERLMGEHNQRVKITIDKTLDHPEADFEEIDDG